MTGWLPFFYFVVDQTAVIAIFVVQDCAQFGWHHVGVEMEFPVFRVFPRTFDGLAFGGVFFDIVGNGFAFAVVIPGDVETNHNVSC